MSCINNNEIDDDNNNNDDDNNNNNNNSDILRINDDFELNGDTGLGFVDGDDLFGSTRERVGQESLSREERMKINEEKKHQFWLDKRRRNRLKVV